MNIIKQHLPDDCYSSKQLKSIDGVVIHFISAVNILPDDPFNLDAIINIFKEYKVSAHYLIRRDGTVIELVPLTNRAHHAGKSCMNDRDWCNNFTVGIELEGGIDFEYTDEQVLQTAQLTGQLMTENHFSFNWVQGHDRVRADWNEKYPEDKASIKRDPGEHFPWEIVKDMLFNISEAVERGYQ